MNLSVSFNSFIYLLLFTISVNKSWSKSAGTQWCGDSHLVAPKGTIKSPWYPLPSPHSIHCTWNILSPPQSTLKIRIKDFDIPDDVGCDHPPCCLYNYLSLPVNEEPGQYKQVCGNISQSIIRVSQNHTIIRFQYESPSIHNRGFMLFYTIEPKACDGEFRCNDGTCLHISKRCDGLVHCADGDDEMGCPGSKCADDEIQCGISDHCYKISDRCDGLFKCPIGEDEKGCSPVCAYRIKCQTEDTCYSENQRCDGHSDCLDNSDELWCADEMCPFLPNKRQCLNGRCIKADLWCNGIDNCGDFSDEQACIKNSMITVAMMGALLGGLCLVLVVGCGLRIYSRRCSSGHNYQLHLSPPGASRMRMPHSLSLPALIDNEFFHREPPPMYSVAVGNVGLPRRSRSNRTRGPLRRSNHPYRHTVTVPVPKPPTENTLNHSSSSPSSEDSLTSSNFQATSNDDNERLINA